MELEDVVAVYASEPNDHYAMVIKVESGSKAVTLCCRTADAPWEPFEPNSKGWSAGIYLVLASTMTEKLLSGAELALEKLKEEP